MSTANVNANGNPTSHTPSPTGTPGSHRDLFILQRENSDLITLFATEEKKNLAFHHWSINSCSQIVEFE